MGEPQIKHDADGRAVRTDRCEIKVLKKTLTAAEVAAIGAATSGAVDFAEALPSGAMFVGCALNITEAFDNAGASSTTTCDVGEKSGDTDAYLDGVDITAVAKVGTPRGVQQAGYCGGVTPTIVFASDVNLNTIVTGLADVYVLYADIEALN